MVRHYLNYFQIVYISFCSCDIIGDNTYILLDNSVTLLVYISCF